MYTTRMDQKYANDMIQYYKDWDENREVKKETLVFPHTE